MSQYYYKENGKWVIDSDWLELQLQSGKKLSNIAKEIGCSYNVVRKFVKSKSNKSNIEDIEIPNNEEEIFSMLKKIDNRIIDFKIIENKPVILVKNSGVIIDLYLNSTMKKITDKWCKQYESVLYLNAHHITIEKWYNNVKKDRMRRKTSNAY